jgi:hypothetical protein
MRQCERRGWAFFRVSPKSSTKSRAGLALDRLRCTALCPVLLERTSRLETLCSRAQHHGSCRDPKPVGSPERKTQILRQSTPPKNALRCRGCGVGYRRLRVEIPQVDGAGNRWMLACRGWSPSIKRRWWLPVAFPWSLGVLHRRTRQRHMNRRRVRISDLRRCGTQMPGPSFLDLPPGRICRVPQEKPPFLTSAGAFRPVRKNLPIPSSRWAMRRCCCGALGLAFLTRDYAAPVRRAAESPGAGPKFPLACRRPGARVQKGQNVSAARWS